MRPNVRLSKFLYTRGSEAFIRFQVKSDLLSWIYPAAQLPGLASLREITALS